jgi:hypothetical protein
VQSNVLKYFEFPSEFNISEIIGLEKPSPNVTSFNFQKSTTTLNFVLPEASVFFA